MRTALLLLIASLVPMLATPTLIQAQQADASPDRGGVHFGLGLGAGSVSASCPGCGADVFEDRRAGVSGVLQIGFFANPKLAISGEFIGWLGNDDDAQRRVAGLGISVLGYPSADGGFFVKGTIGGIRAIAENDVLIVQTDAFMTTTGIGYDMPVADGVGVTLYANYVRAFGGSTWVNGFSSDVVVTPNALQAGIALTVH